MEYSLAWSSQDLEPVLVIGLTLLGFLIWFFVSKSEKIYRNLVARYGQEEGQTRRIYMQRLLGFVVFGVVPAIVLFSVLPYSWEEYGVAAKFPAETFYWILGLSPVLILMTRNSTRKPESLAMYPEVRKPNWDQQTFLLSALGWMLYLLAYEWMFRGFLLYGCIRELGVWPAIAINTIIYSLVHVPKGQTEAIGAIPLGILLCIITIRTETIIVATVVHWVLSLANEWYSLKWRTHP